MVSESSPIIDFYPVDFDTDLNGKQQEWEAVVLIPFIQEDKLKEAMAPYKNMLTEEEKSSKSYQTC
jgi:5'-3' exoribonuclease 1